MTSTGKGKESKGKDGWDKNGWGKDVFGKGGNDKGAYGKGGYVDKGGYGDPSPRPLNPSMSNGGRTRGFYFSIFL